MEWKTVQASNYSTFTLENRNLPITQNLVTIIHCYLPIEEVNDSGNTVEAFTNQSGS